jgi:hypothetical protein
VSALAGAAVRRALAFLVEPPNDLARPRHDSALVITVVGISRACGASTVARGLALEMPRARVGEMARPVPGGVVVAVADGRGEPVLAAIVAEALAAHNDRVVLVANRPDDPAEWSQKGALCVPASRLGAMLVARGRRPIGGMAGALRGLARAVEGKQGDAPGRVA